METKKYYLNKDEFWPMAEIDLVRGDPNPVWGHIVDIPVALVQEYTDAYNRFYELNEKIMREYHPDDEF